jgi:hypothetical protein
MSNKKPDPSVVSSAYQAMAPAWAKIEMVLAGTEAMRAAGSRYLPQHQNEKDTAYRERCARTTLLNMAQITLDAWVGRPFSDPIKVEDDVPAKVKELLDDVDLQGNAVGVFARNWFREGTAKAFAHVLVDFPSRPDNMPRSLADDAKESLRPYWTFIKPENLIAAYATIINGREVLTHARIREYIIQRVGFEEKAVLRIRVFDRVLPGEGTPGVYFSLWELQGEGKKAEWAEVQPKALLDIDEIPIVTFYADRQGVMLGKSPIEDLVDLNIRHWQSTSDQIHVLTVARFPILAVSGVVEDESKPVVVGPNRTLTTPDPAARWYYVEHSGAAIAAGRTDLLDLEEQMSNYGAQYLKKRPDRESATARALDAAEATSPLQDAAMRFNDALNQALYLTAKWMKLDEGGALSIAMDFGPEIVYPADFDALKAARQGRDISRETFLRELERRGVLGDEFDIDEDKEKLDGEAIDGMAMTGPIDLQAVGENDPEEEEPAPPAKKAGA